MLSRRKEETSRGKEETSRRKEDQTPKLLSISSSLDSSAPSDKWKHAYEPAPIISQTICLLVGVVVFVVAWIWPPLVLLLAYMASKAIPYSFRENDDARQRRQLCHEFYMQASNHPEKFTRIPNNIQLEESYWKNERYLFVLCA